MDTMDTSESVIQDNILFFEQHLNQAYMRESVIYMPREEATTPPPRDMLLLVNGKTGKIIAIGNTLAVEKGIISVPVSVGEDSTIDTGLFPKELLGEGRENLVRTLQVWNQSIHEKPVEVS
ncbi:MAG: hypothetical protein RIQ54_441 [Candidatus Parcubacteria bacterium]|jgi:hypothetical protein